MAFKVVVAAVVLAQAVFGVKWDQMNDPATWNSSFVYNLAKLPTVAQAARIPWSDTYWPSYRGGIANRWQDTENGAPGFEYKLHTLEELKNGTVNLNILSPAEKFDIFHSRYDYPLLNSEWQRVNPNDASWEGICHGWAPAAIFYEQPNNVTMTNKDGLQIPFGSSDVKALLSYFLAQFAQGQEKTSFIANRCNTDLQKQPAKANNPECWDANPGTFHVMLTNMIGLASTGFVCDIDRSIEVWNQPMAKYEYTLGATSEPNNNSAPGTVKEQAVSLTMYYTKETQPTAAPHEPLILNNQYNYVLDLDANGNILGGSYDSNQWERLDFMWAEEVPAFFGYFTELETIYKAATKNSTGETRVAARRRIGLADYNPRTVTDGVVRLTSYDEQTQRAWLVPAKPRSVVPMRLLFASLNTRRYTDFVRVFEVENGQIGTPIAVVHGTSLPQDIVLRPGVSALITFSVDQMAARRMSSEIGSGFEIFVM